MYQLFKLIQPRTQSIVREQIAGNKIMLADSRSVKSTAANRLVTACGVPLSAHDYSSDGAIWEEVPFSDVPLPLPAGEQER